MMMESCNTSFQIHFQVGPKEFAGAYNTAQAITAPVLAAAVNSPILRQAPLARNASGIVSAFRR